MLTKSSRGSTNPASYPVLHRNYRRLQYEYCAAVVICSTNNALFILQVTIAVVEDWELG